MRKFNMLLLIGAIALVPACNSDKGGKSDAMTSGGNSSAAPASNAEFEKLMGEAEKAYDEAIAMGAAWRDTKKILTKARAAAAGNDVNKATALAQQALAQSQMAQKQSKDQQNAGPYLF